MNRCTALGAWCLTLVLCPALQVGNTEPGSYQSLETAEKRSAVLTEKLREIVSLLRIVWRQDFDSNYQKYMLGPSPTVILIPREEMIRIAAARLDGRRRDGETTQGMTIGDEHNVKIVVVYDDIAPLLVARTINHEIGHLQLRDKGMSRNKEEAHIRKTVDTLFFEKMFGQDWMKATVAALKKGVIPIEKNGRQYQGYRPDAVEAFYRQLIKAGAKLEKTPLHDRIVASLVFILTNSEENLLAALDAEDGAEQFSQEELPHIIVVVCDMVGLDFETRLLAKKHTIRIFRRAGINVNWIDANELTSTAPLSSSRAKCMMPSMESYLVVVISPRGAIGWAPGQMGVAPTRVGAYKRAYVRYDLVETFVDTFMPGQKGNSGVGAILGHVIAHELGHLLIPGQVHTEQGIMRERWGRHQATQAAQGDLLFHPDHVKLMQDLLRSK
jgi:hypothetical protein